MAKPFELVLKALPGAGYSWQVSATPSDLVKITTRFVVSNPKVIGGPGEEHFLITGLKAGEVHLKATYGRSWEKECSQVKEFDLAIDNKFNIKQK